MTKFSEEWFKRFNSFYFVINTFEKWLTQNYFENWKFFWLSVLFKQMIRFNWTTFLWTVDFWLSFFALKFSLSMSKSVILLFMVRNHFINVLKFQLWNNHLNHFIGKIENSIKNSKTFWLAIGFSFIILNVQYCQSCQ